MIRKDESEDQTQELVKTPNIAAIKQFTVDQEDKINKLHLATP